MATNSSWWYLAAYEAGLERDTLFGGVGPTIVAGGRDTVVP